MDKNTLIQKLALANLDVISTDVLPLIEKSYAQVAAQEGLERLKSTVLAVLDEDLNNKEQINLIWGKLTADPEIIEAVRAGLLDAVTLVDDETVKTGLSLLVGPITQTLVAVTDEVKPNGEQIKKVWLDFVKSPEVLAFLLGNADVLIVLLFKNPTLQKILLSIFKLFGKG